MPTRVRTHQRARHAKIGESLKVVLQFVNIGRATYDRYIFNADEPEQAVIRHALTPILARLHNASANGRDMPPLDREAQLDALLPTLPADLPDVNEEPWTIPELAENLKVSRGLLIRYIDCGALPAYQFQGEWRIKNTDAIAHGHSTLRQCAVVLKTSTFK